MKKMVWRGSAFVLVLPCLLLLQSVAISQTNNSRISGQVFGATRRPLPDVYVELLNEVDSVLQRARTTGSGNFLFVGLSSGRFFIRVRPFGTDYEEQTQEVELVTSLGRTVAG